MGRALADVGLTPMRILLFLLALLPMVARAANPAFQDFNATQFATNGFKVALTNGVIATNLTGIGSMTLNTSPVLTNVPSGTASASGTAGRVPVFNTTTSLVNSAFSSTSTNGSLSGGFSADNGVFTNALTLGGTGVVRGGGTAGKIPVMTGTNALGDSAFSSTGTNGSLAGVFSANGGAFSNTLTLSGSTVLTNVPAGTASASGTANLMAKFTNPTNLGNSSVTDNGTSVTMTEPLLFSADNTLDIGASNATRAARIWVGSEFLAPRGTNTAPGFGFAAVTNTGVYLDGNSLGFTVGTGGVGFSYRNSGGSDYALLTTSVFRMRNDAFITFYSTTTPVTGGGSDDTLISRESAAIFQFGADAATPVVQTLKGPDGSGTDKPGTNFTIAPSRGTGTGGGGTFYVATAGPGAASAATQNVLTNRLSVDNQGSVAISNFNGTATALVGSSASNTLSTVTLGSGLTLSAGTLTSAGDSSGTNIVTLAQTGTNVTAMDFSLVQNGGLFKLSLTNNAFIPTPSNVGTTTFKHCWLAVQQPSTGTCFVTWTNASFGAPEGQSLINDTNNGSVVYYEMVTDPFTNMVQVWMSTRMKLMP